MMAYAAYSHVSTDPIEGGIEITEEQYLEAIEGMVLGMVVTIDGGFKVAWPVIEIPEPPVLTPEQLRAEAISTRNDQLSYATLMIAPLQDAVDFEMATQEEADLLRAWKLYRISLNRIEQQAGFPGQIDWPAPPA